MTFTDRSRDVHVQEECRVRVHRGFRCARLEISGEVDVAATRRLEAGLLEAFEAVEIDLVVVDVTEVTFADSTLVRLLVPWATRARDAGVATSVEGAGPEVATVVGAAAAVGLLPDWLRWARRDDRHVDGSTRVRIDARPSAHASGR